MSNPRPCVCGHPESDHDGCLGPRHAYRATCRKEPLRAESRLCSHGRPGVVNMVDHIGFGPFVESVPGRVECPPECYDNGAFQRCPETRSDEHSTLRCEHEAGHAGRHRATFMAPGALEWWDDAAAS